MPCGLPILKMPGAKVCASLLLSFAVIPQLSLLSFFISLENAVAALAPPSALSNLNAWALGPLKTLVHQWLPLLCSPAHLAGHVNQPSSSDVGLAQPST